MRVLQPQDGVGVPPTPHRGPLSCRLWGGGKKVRRGRAPPCSSVAIAVACASVVAMGGSALPHCRSLTPPGLPGTGAGCISTGVSRHNQRTPTAVALRPLPQHPRSPPSSTSVTRWPPTATCSSATASARSSATPEVVNTLCPDIEYLRIPVMDGPAARISQVL